MVRLSVLLPLILTAAQAHEVITTRLTWNREISRIIYRRCLSCHRQGGQAPMSLLTYQEARPWAKAMKEEVLERRMPPWGAVKGFGDFRDDAGLTQEEIMLLADWVEGGAPEGEAGWEPYPPERKTAQKPAAAVPGILAKGTLTLKSSIVLRAIAPADVAEGASLKVIAQRPDGTVEPLLWLLPYKAKWRRTYEYRAPISLPAGAKVVAYPAESGSVRLIR